MVYIPSTITTDRGVQFESAFSALRAQSTPESWTESLPLVLLGICTAVKEDLQFPTTELVYGTTLRLPGDFIYSSPPSAPFDYVTRLWCFMADLKAKPSRTPSPQQLFVHPTLSKTLCVFVQ